MAWDIILKSFGVILVIMIIAQGLYIAFGDKNDPEAGSDS